MVCDKGYIWNPSNCVCECDKLYDIGQYLDYKNCVCRKSLVDKLVEECINVIDGDTMYNETLTVESSNGCSSYTTYIILFLVFLSISAVISDVFIYYRCYGDSLVQRTYKNRKNDVPTFTYSMGGELDY